MNLLEAGAEVAGYRIESLLGRGGMAVVYRAHDPRLGRSVALKLLPPELMENEQFRLRFIRESRLAASLDHPNIIPIYEAGEADGQLYIVMRLVLGSDLKAVIGGRPLEPPRALGLIAQACNALDAAHAQGLVHRDVKPGNILVSPGADQSEHVYLTDFGLTKRTTSLSGALTRTGNFLGTIDYVAPEQIAARPVDARTDVYALGCVVYECLTGELPFHRDDDAALLWAHLAETPPPVTALQPGLGPDVAAVVTRAMAKAPEDRYASCHGLLIDLRDALELPEPLPRPRPRTHVVAPDPVVPVESPPSQHPSFPPGTFPPEGALPAAADSREEDERPARKSRYLVPIALGTALVVALGAALAAFLLTRGDDLSQRQQRDVFIPFSFRYPGDWGKTQANIHVVVSPAVDAVGPLFLPGGAADTWSGTRQVLQDRASDAVGMYTSFSSAQLDNPTTEQLQAAVGQLLPTGLEFQPATRQVVGGHATAVLEGDLTDPSSGSVLRVVTYVVQVHEPEPRLVQMTFFSAPDAYEDNRETFDKILATVVL
ncbi:MAG: serine/threonine-protein kinase [Actinomycetes bacterium]